MPSQIPGQFINSVGGALIVGPYGGIGGGAGRNTSTMIGAGINPGNNCVPPAAVPNQVTWIDCTDWTLGIAPIYDEVTGTYSYGGVNRDKTAEDWGARANVVLDQRYPVDMLLKYGVIVGKGNALASTGGSQFYFNSGVELILVQGCGTNYPSNQTIDFYYCPSAKLSVNGPGIDAGNKKDVRYSVSIVGNARIFKLPAECNVLADYLGALAARGQVW